MQQVSSLINNQIRTRLLGTGCAATAQYHRMIWLYQKEKKYDSESEKPNISRRIQSAALIYHGTAFLNIILTNARCLTNEVTSPQCRCRRCLTDGLMTRTEINKGICTECLRTIVATWRRHANNVQI